MKQIRIATRRSPLAMKQSYLVRDLLEERLPGCEVIIMEMVTTGDKQLNWSLENKGGKGLFTKELEDALLNKEADIAVHSAKDLPTECPDKLTIAGFLPREIANDVLIIRESVQSPKTIATSSPRRRSQAKKLFTDIQWSEIRGNVDTRLNKIKEGHADATFMAAAGLKRLNIQNREGLRFEQIDIQKIVPATGQAAIAIQCREDDKDFYRQLCDSDTIKNIELERTILAAIGGGCHTATAIHSTKKYLYLFDEKNGYKRLEKSNKNEAKIVEEALGFLKSLKHLN